MLKDRGRLEGLQISRSTIPDLDHECGRVCTECGRIEEPAEGAAQATPLPCPHCQQDAWAPLRLGVVVEALDMNDSDRRSDADSGGLMGHISRWMVGGLCLAAASSGAWSIVVGLQYQSDPMLASKVAAGPLIASYVITALVVFCCAAVAIVMFARSFREIRDRVRPRFPTRWRYCNVSTGWRAPRRRGTVEGRRSITAPFSGEPCVAYQLGVRTDDIEPHRAWSWSLVEQEVQIKSVASSKLTGPVRLEVVPQVFSRPPAGTPAAQRVDAALRERGVDPSRLDLQLFERRLQEGEEVTARIGQHGAVVVVVS